MMTIFRELLELAVCGLVDGCEMSGAIAVCPDGASPGAGVAGGGVPLTVSLALPEGCAAESWLACAAAGCAVPSRMVSMTMRGGSFTVCTLKLLVPSLT